MSLSVPAGRREKEIDVFAAAAFTEGFDETGEFAYAAESVAAPEGCTALFDACAPVDYYAFIQGNLYAYSGGVRVPLIAFTGIPARVSGTAADGKDCDVFCGDGKIFTFSGSASAVKTGVGSDGMENAYKNRLVRVSGGKIFLSAPFAPFDFGTAGAEMQPPATAGKVLRAVEADGALCAFCERGIWRCGGTDDASARLSPYPFSYAELLPETVRSCGGRAFFATAAGRVYAFDGALKKIADLKEPLSAAKSAVGGVLYLLFYGKNAFIYDTETCRRARVATEEEIGFADGKYLAAGGFYTLKRVKNGGGRIATRPLDFGEGAPKKLSALSFEGKGRIALTVSAERDVKEFYLSSGERIYPKMSGRKFSFAIACPAGARADKIRAVYTPTGVK